MFFHGAPEGIRIPDLPLRRRPLYPAELRAHIELGRSDSYGSWRRLPEVVEGPFTENGADACQPYLLCQLRVDLSIILKAELADLRVLLKAQLTQKNTTRYAFAVDAAKDRQG